MKQTQILCFEVRELPSVSCEIAKAHYLFSIPINTTFSDYIIFQVTYSVYYRNFFNDDITIQDP
jgi:hypothetical protein